MPKWEIKGDFAYLTYSDGEVIKVSKDKFHSAFGPIVSASKEDVKRDFAIEQ